MTRYASRTATIVLLALGLVALWASGCTDPVAALGAINATSSVVAGHSHRCAIPLSDVDDPPPNGRTYTTTTDGTPPNEHAHTVFLTAAQLTDLQTRNSVVDLLTSEVQGHTHRFLFER